MEISEPDILVVNFKDPGLFIDAETKEPLAKLSFEKRFMMGVQYTKLEFEELVKKAETAAKVSVVITILELLMVLLFKKVLFSMWILILTLQFFIYIGTWKIRYPNTLEFIIYELKRIALGEFMDDFDFANTINETIGLPINENDSTTETVDEERLGSASISESFGATLILFSIVFVILILLVAMTIIMVRRFKLSNKMKERINSLKTKIFWNPIIRYLILNSLKLNMSAIVVFKLSGAGIADIATAITILAGLVGAPLVFYVAMRRYDD